MSRAWPLIFLLTLFGCLGPREKLVTATEAVANTLDPARAFSDRSLLVLSQVYEPLISYHYLVRPFRMESLLASKAPAISGGGKIFRFDLKTGVRYHPHSALGLDRRVRADDFITQFKRLVDPAVKSPIQNMLAEKILGMREALEQVKGSPSRAKALLNIKVKGLRELSEHSFEVELVEPDNFFIYWFSTYFIVPVPREVVELGIDLEKEHIGTGPYQLHYADKRYSFKKFKNYREAHFPTLADREASIRGYLKDAKKRIPFLNQFEIMVEENFEKRLQLFLDEEIDWMDVSNTEYGRVSKDERIVELLDAGEIDLSNSPSLAMRWLGFNMQDPTVGGEAGLKIRQAIAYAIDREKYNEVLSNGTNMEANSIINPGIWGYSPSSKPPFHFNLSKAKEFLKDVPKPIKIKYSTRTDAPIGITEANFFKQELKKIGIEVQVEVLTFKQFLDQGRKGRLQFWTDYWIYDYPDAQNILQLLYSKNAPGINKSSIRDKRIDELYEALLKDPSNVRKMQYLKQIEDQFNQILPWVLLSYDRSYFIARKHVKNLKKSSFIRNYFKFLNVQKH